MLRARLDRHKCIGAGNCITIAPTAFDWLRGEFGKAEVLDVESVDEDQLREAALACPTKAIEIEDIEELLPWQLRGTAGPARRVVKTFMFTDIVGSTNLLETIGDEAWEDVARWHNETLQTLIRSHRGEVVHTTGDGLFAAFDDAAGATTCAVAIQRKLAEHRRAHGFAPQVRIGLHAAEATAVADDYAGIGVHEAARVGALAEGGEIVVTSRTLEAEPIPFPVGDERAVSLKGLANLIPVVSVEWRPTGRESRPS